MPIRAVAYVSESPDTDPLKVDQIAADAAAFNLQPGVTGVLLFDDTRFLQYIEGPEDGLGIALQRVYGATSHENVIELNRGRVGRRQFPFWSMHWIRVDQMELGKVAISDWTGFARASENLHARISAVDQLSIIVSSHLTA
ncbi:BLUF domain-containing protein [Stenotrophomonas maltophilia]|uniref:BLUF domain-containing protein n=1 Tax=Stenotrophomonas maltophilia TaxID=40324 RepID=UPI0021C5DB53|nr:BLUF domain-containing protein [Stenotrophomonas maltophilia]MCU1169672.1 BLUF domain-containing protein [Stenotrophomonas maltophilia]